MLSRAKKEKHVKTSTEKCSKIDIIFAESSAMKINRQHSLYFTEHKLHKNNMKNKCSKCSTGQKSHWPVQMHTQTQNTKQKETQCK